MKQDDILLYSGGLDSFIAYHFLSHHLKHPPSTVYVDLGHRYADAEWDAVVATLPNTEYMYNLNLEAFEEENANIPYRNAFLFLQAALQFPPKQGRKTVYHLVCQQGEMNNTPDRTDVFFVNMTHMLRLLSKNNHVVCSPVFRSMTKTEMVKWFIDTYPLPNYRKKRNQLLSTSSCYDPKWDTACGKCSACFRRWVAMSLNGIEEKPIHIINKDTLIVKEYTKRLKKMNPSEREEKRWVETTEALSIIGVIV